MTGSNSSQLLASIGEQRIRYDQQGVDLPCSESGEGCVKLLLGAGLNDVDWPAQRLGRLFDLSRIYRGDGITGLINAPITFAVGISS
jgi:hypothetical protein